MTSRHETETNLENESTHRARPTVPAGSEAAYDRLTGYAFARRYAGGKVVADIGWEEVGYGSSVLAETAESVAGLTGSPEAVALASAAYPAPNVDYRRVDLPSLPFPEDHFDVVVALGVIENLENPEGLVSEARRVLKRGGVLVISVPDKLARAGERRGMYVPELRGMLERHFERAHFYRQGVVAGGVVFPDTSQEAETVVEMARPSLPRPRFGMRQPPATRSVVAVCGDLETALQEEQPYLLLDRDRSVFDEREELAEHVGLLQAEIRQMQETEVQAFRDTIELRKSLAAEVGRYVFHLRNYRIHLRNIAVGVSAKADRNRYAFHLRRSPTHFRNIAVGVKGRLSRELTAYKDRRSD